MYFFGPKQTFREEGKRRETMTNCSTEVVEVVEGKKQLDNLLELFPDLDPGSTENAIRTFKRRNKGLKPLVLPNISVNGDYQERLEQAFLQLKQKDGHFSETCSSLPKLKRIENPTKSALKKAGRIQGGDLIVIPYQLLSLPADGKYCRNNSPETIGGFIHLPLLHLCWLILANNINLKSEVEIICPGDRLSAEEVCRVATVEKRKGLQVTHRCPNARFKSALALVCRPL